MGGAVKVLRTQKVPQFNQRAVQGKPVSIERNVRPALCGVDLRSRVKGDAENPAIASARLWWMNEQQKATKRLQPATKSGLHRALGKGTTQSVCVMYNYWMVERSEHPLVVETKPDTDEGRVICFASLSRLLATEV